MKKLYKYLKEYRIMIQIWHPQGPKEKRKKKLWLYHILVS